MAASYFPPPPSIIGAPPTLSTYSSSHNLHNHSIDAEKQQAIQRKFQLLMLKFNPVPFVPSKNLDFSKHESMLKMLGLWYFVHLEFDTGVRVNLVAELVATYDPKFQCSYVNGTRITVNGAHLARAMKLHMKKSNVVELDLKKDSMEFIVDFLLNWVLLHGDKYFLPVEVLNWVKVIKDGHPEKLDWAGLLWFMVENELSRGVNLEDCYYASHLQLLIKSQCEDVFLEREAEKMELDDLHKEMKKKDERIVCLERELSENRNLVECYEEALDEMEENVERYKETLKEMHNVVEECKKMCWFPEESLEETKILAKCNKKSLKIPFEAICKNDESKSECKKKLLGVHKVSTSSWKSFISSDKLKSKNIYLGTYQSAEAAARAYDAANLCLNRSKAKLNFPNSSSSIASYLPPSDTIMSIEIIKRVAAEAAKNTCYMENEVNNNGEGESSKSGQKEVKRKGYEVHENGSNKKLKIQPKSQCKNKFIGVYKQSLGSKWQSQIKSAKLRIYLGIYESESFIAARAYDAANLCLNGSKAKLNFPMSSYIQYLPPSDAVMSAETIKRVASAAANNTSFIQNPLTNNGEGDSSKPGQKEVKLEE